MTARSIDFLLTSTIDVNKSKTPGFAIILADLGALYVRLSIVVIDSEQQ